MLYFSLLPVHLHPAKNWSIFRIFLERNLTIPKFEFRELTACHVSAVQHSPSRNKVNFLTFFKENLKFFRFFQSEIQKFKNLSMPDFPKKILEFFGKFLERISKITKSEYTVYYGYVKADGFKLIFFCHYSWKFLYFSSEISKFSNY